MDAVANEEATPSDIFRLAGMWQVLALNSLEPLSFYAGVLGINQFNERLPVYQQLSDEVTHRLYDEVGIPTVTAYFDAHPGARERFAPAIDGADGWNHLANTDEGFRSMGNAVGEALEKWCDTKLQKALEGLPKHTITLAGKTMEAPAHRIVVLHTTHDLTMRPGDISRTGKVESVDDFDAAIHEGVKWGIGDLIGRLIYLHYPHLLPKEGVEAPDGLKRFEHSWVVAYPESRPDVNYEDIVREVWEMYHEIKPPFDPNESVWMLNPSHEKWGFIIMPLLFEKALKATLQETLATLAPTPTEIAQYHHQHNPTRETDV